MFGRNKKIISKNTSSSIQSSRGKSTITVNGKTITVKGNNISVANGRIIVDGKVMEEGLSGDVNVILSGDIKHIDVTGSVTVNGDVFGDIDAGSSVNVSGNITGYVDAGSSVSANNITGDVDAGSSVNANNINGGVS